MRKVNHQPMKKLLSALLVTALTVASIPISASAKTSDDTVIVVSLGDSYSSGEGIEPFYGQNKELSEKVKDEDWLAHRSTKGWPTLLEIPGVSRTTGNYNVKTSESSVCKWYFAAVSGAETKHFSSEKQKKTYKKDKPGWFTGDYEGTVELPKQLDVFDGLYGDVDYVTLSVGGNDVGFADIVTTCAMKNQYLHVGKGLDEQLNDLWADFDTTRANIKQVYKDIEENAGRQATIIVAGYPKLFNQNGKGVLISKSEASTVNSNVSKFNDKIEEIVKECQNEGISIHFVDVEDAFNEHEAYSSDAWINKIKLTMQDEDLTDSGIGSAYSMHPNADGAKAYARCVNAAIASLGTLSGKVVKASDRISPINKATIGIYKKNEFNSNLFELYTFTETDASGNYQLRLPEGEYKIVISAEGYINFEAYTNITKQNINYMETFLMVEGAVDGTGIASGKVFDGLTGNGISDVTLTIRKGWNTPNDGGVSFVDKITTDSSGSYSVELPFGNYTVYASKEGYISTSFNIICQEGTTGDQNGTMSSTVLGDGYRIILTWGEYPEDLDSHVEGTLSDGSWFHVYYQDMYAYDGDFEVCNLDVDDTTSWGPETITLNPNTDSPYYYYIYRYAGSGTVASSSAQIKVYQGETLINTFNVPTDLGESDYWNVFAIKNGQLIVKNTITDYADTSYLD